MRRMLNFDSTVKNRENIAKIRLEEALTGKENYDILLNCVSMDEIPLSAVFSRKQPVFDRIQWEKSPAEVVKF